MKVALNSSARDAQIRDSFNKESFVATRNNNALVTTCKFLYDLQSQLPRNASKLHSLVVTDDFGYPLYLLNFEVLRSSLTVTSGDDAVGVCFNELPVNATKLSARKKVTESQEKGDESHDN